MFVLSIINSLLILVYKSFKFKEIIDVLELKIFHFFICSLFRITLFLLPYCLGGYLNMCYNSILIKLLCSSISLCIVFLRLAIVVTYITYQSWLILTFYMALMLNKQNLLPFRSHYPPHFLDRIVLSTASVYLEHHMRWYFNFALIIK